MHNPFTLEGKTLLVTGASSGIGRAVAIECSRAGARVLITARNEERLRETLSRMEGDAHTLIAADLSGEEDHTRLIACIPALDGLVHCAGLTRTKLFPFVDRETLDEVMAVNFTAPALLSARLVREKKLRKGGSIVFISSISGSGCVWAGNAMYSASKGAINGLMKNMALDLAQKGIRVNSMNPGMVETPIVDAGVITPEQLEADKKRYPLKRYGRPEEVAYGVIYLLSGASAWMTGSALVLDGGYTLL
ncbi:MAG: SDR family oxidoreductase [Treponema sp.]|jgi:NAD(P)-dependent dehydrogenase (short-subunit alcohol dehydrogenase family)|nr:SDR family oxidoreductase [Treponema sp.]